MPLYIGFVLTYNERLSIQKKKNLMSICLRSLGNYMDFDYNMSLGYNLLIRYIMHK